MWTGRRESSANLPSSFEVKAAAFLLLVFLFVMTGILFTAATLFHVQILKAKIAYFSQRFTLTLWPA